ncbi:transcriptional activator NhaR [Haliangium ochraceum]|uniref:Transcriptional regulator, LysR family n=1 Tax=Haliangium ochraceum (strain DSM 14365 / JCM 11303 / SMP-2) TaxID=502025 RepID=D0LQZ1_HALO1|nr:transcriptional activator NhaR [Haliangium ochraceum]ACY15499.1 transcriptional regulator, LysR family [Haliangium ochraceum DSM 14365]
MTEWLNYHHLLYFWTVAREGSIVRASRVLHLAQPTISGQLRTLEDSIGEKLFARVGRNLELTEVGQMVYRYADEIFSLGRELQDTLKGRPSGRPLKLHVGVADVLPKLLAHRLLGPALEMEEPVQIICREDKTERLLAELAINGLDLVLADTPIAGNARVKAYNHLLGECGLSFLATAALARRYRSKFPHSLDGAPMLLPTENTLLRRSMDQWFDTIDVRPQIVAEFEDSALLKVFGQQGAGIFAVPSAVQDEVIEHYQVRALGSTDAVKERVYAITVERRIKNPAVAAISARARAEMFQ